MKFLKYNHNFAWGCSAPEYLHLRSDFDDDIINEIIVDLAEEYDYSEKYRGITYEVISDPPKEWLADQIKSLQNTIDYSTYLIEQYNTKLI